jgi:hypothetical protein
VVPPTAAELLRALGTCTQELTTGRYRTDSTSAARIPVCGTAGAVFFEADMDISCNGQRTPTCNEGTDPWFIPETTARDSTGQPLDAAAVPFVVVPAPSARFDHRVHDIPVGSVVAVIFQNRVEYAVFGNLGSPDIIGEGSHALASRLAINPDPRVGGTVGPVTYAIFKGASARVERAEDHAEAVRVGQAAAAAFVAGRP